LQAESLRLHYALTLERWNFMQHIAVIRQSHDERFIRMWSLYLRGCAAAFRVSELDIYQLLFTKDLNNHIPLTYDHVYGSR
jgi:cyclopropane-fatty-acyl-phospholipid synthase